MRSIRVSSDISLYLARRACDPRGDPVALLRNETTGYFFGTAFEVVDEADAFLAWCDAESIDPAKLQEEWPCALTAFRRDWQLGRRESSRCREPYCFQHEPLGSGWGLCITHALGRDDEEDHRNCPGCDDCFAGSSRGGVP